MCTLHLFPAEYAKQHSKQIILDSEDNSDGTSLVIIQGGEIVVRVQSLIQEPILKLIKTYSETMPDSVFAVHLRMASVFPRNCQAINGCHWFSTPSGDWTYSHNGHIRQGVRYRVDSMILENFLDGIEPECLEPLPYHFANVIAVHVSGIVAVHRSQSGSLYTSKCKTRFSSRTMVDVGERLETGWHFPGWTQDDETSFYDSFER